MIVSARARRSRNGTEFSQLVHFRFGQSMARWAVVLLFVFAGTTCADPVVDLQIFNNATIRATIIFVGGQDFNGDFTGTVVTTGVLKRRERLQLVRTDGTFVTSRRCDRNESGSLSLRVRKNVEAELLCSLPETTRTMLWPWLSSPMIRVRRPWPLLPGRTFRNLPHGSAHAFIRPIKCIPALAHSMQVS